MFHARAWAAAVPQAVWTAVAGLALLASVGLALVVGAGLSVWKGAVIGRVAPPAVVVEPPRSGLILVSPPATPHVPKPTPTTPATVPVQPPATQAVPPVKPAAQSVPPAAVPASPPSTPSSPSTGGQQSVPRASAVARERSNGRPSANGKHWKQESSRRR